MGRFFSLLCGSTSQYKNRAPLWWQHLVAKPGDCGLGSLPLPPSAWRAQHGDGYSGASLQMCTLKIHTGKPQHPLSHFSFCLRKSGIFKSFQWKASISRSDKMSSFWFQNVPSYLTAYCCVSLFLCTGVTSDFHISAHRTLRVFILSSLLMGSAYSIRDISSLPDGMCLSDPHGTQLLNSSRKWNIPLVIFMPEQVSACTGLMWQSVQKGPSPPALIVQGSNQCFFPQRKRNASFIVFKIL